MKNEVNSVKLGLGSSAALTVSLTAALASFAGKAKLIQNKADWLHHLLAIHRRFQNGVGSGVDLAASLYGGTLIYQLQQATHTPKAQAVSWPQDLHTLCVWSGQAASTSDFVTRYKAWREQASPATEHLLTELKAIAVSSAKAMAEADTAALLESVQHYADGLKRLSSASGINIFSPQHRHIEALANSVGVIYKPCGAGGGDIGLAVTNEPERLNVLEQKLKQSGFAVLTGMLDKGGLTCSPEGLA